VLGDRGTDCSGERIATDDHDAAQRGLPEQQRREQARRLVDAEVLDVVDHEHARLHCQRLRERAGDAAKRAFGARAKRGRAVAGMALDHGARRAERGGELCDEPRLARSERPVQRHQRDDGEVLLELGELGLPADKRHRSDGGHWIGDLVGAAPHRSRGRAVSKL